jgi:hypothetical protein
LALAVFQQDTVGLAFVLIVGDLLFQLGLCCLELALDVLIRSLEICIASCQLLDFLFELMALRS